MVPLTNEGIERSDLELTGDVAGATYVYSKDMPKIVNSIIRDPSQGLGIDKMKAVETDFRRVWREQLQKVPF